MNDEDHTFLEGAVYGAAFFALCIFLLGPVLGTAVYASSMLMLRVWR